MHNSPHNDPPETESAPIFHIVLVEPDIPPNTGNIARLCAGASCWLHLIEPLGFRLNDRTLKRAGLDYWNAVHIQRHNSLDAFFETIAPERFFLFSTKGRKTYTDITYRKHDALIFGSETRGLSEQLLEAHPEKTLYIPMNRTAIRSMNLSNAVAVALYEGLRQTRFPLNSDQST